MAERKELNLERHTRLMSVRNLPMEEGRKAKHGKGRRGRHASLGKSAVELMMADMD